MTRPPSIVDAPGLAERLGDTASPDPTLIDVRTPAEFEAGPHPGSGQRATVLRGGIVDWQATGGDLNRGRQTWELERQVRLAAGSLVVTGIAASAVAPPAKWLSAVVGGGLVFAAVSNRCAMGMALARMPWNRRGARATCSALDQLTAGR